MKGFTELQSEILRKFFASRNDFFSDGGPLDEGERTLRQIASELDLSIETVRRFGSRGDGRAGVPRRLMWQRPALPLFFAATGRRRGTPPHQPARDAGAPET
jgi:hypothetical protein